MKTEIAKAVKTMIEKDRDHLVRPERDVAVCPLAERVYGHEVPDWHGRLLDVTDRVVSFLRVKPGEEDCDGASLCPDKIEWLGLDLAPSYLTHDGGYAEMDRIAEDPAWKAAGWTQAELRRLWDDLLGMMVRRQAEALKGWKKAAGNALARIMRSACRAFGGIAHGRLGVAAAVLLSVAGCAVPPDESVVEEWIWRPEDKVEYTVVPKDPAGTEPDLQDSPVAAPEPEPAPEPVQEAPKEAPVAWRYGGFDGSKAQVDGRCRLSGIKVRESGMSVKWESRAPSDWKRDKDGLVVCAAFHWDGAQWVGGKFDWIDESRTTRDWKNVRSGYNGWMAEPFFAAKRHAFCVVSADGKKRSPLAEE